VRHKVAFVAVLVVTAFTPAVIERIAPQAGAAPRRALFCLLVLYFGALGPYLAFRPSKPKEAQATGEASRWAKAALCTAWLLFCAFFLYSGLAGEA